MFTVRKSNPRNIFIYIYISSPPVFPLSKLVARISPRVSTRPCSATFLINNPLKQRISYFHAESLGYNSTGRGKIRATCCDYRAPNNPRKNYASSFKVDRESAVDRDRFGKRSGETRFKSKIKMERRMDDI